MFAFLVAEFGNDVEEWVAESDLSSRDKESYEPNRHWYRVVTRSREDAKEWVRLRRLVLSLSWEPNQSRDTQIDSAARIARAAERMRSIEIDQHTVET